VNAIYATAAKTVALVGLLLVFSAFGTAPSAAQSADIILLRGDPGPVARRLGQLTPDQALGEIAKLKSKQVAVMASDVMHTLIFVVRDDLPAGTKIRIEHHILRSKADPRHRQQKGPFGKTFVVGKNQAVDPVVIVNKSKPIGVGKVKTSMTINGRKVKEIIVGLN
jgi:hypothetical protein